MGERILYNHVNLAAEVAYVSSCLLLCQDGVTDQRILQGLEGGVVLCEDVAQWLDLVKNPRDYFSERSLRQEQFVRSLDHIPAAQDFFRNVEQIKTDLSYLLNSLQQEEKPEDLQSRAQQAYVALPPSLSMALLEDDAIQRAIQRGDFRRSQ